MIAYYNDNDPFCAEWLRNLIAACELPPGVVDERSITDVRPEDLDGYTQAHFFCGLGGWPLALQLAGWPADAPVWTGSCPCQPFSSAGKGLGEKDRRHLWPEFFRLIRECKPPVVFGEQVASAEVVGTQLEAAFALAVQRGDYARANKFAKRLVKSHGFHYWARWVDRVHADLETATYTLRYTILGAHSVGAPHIRQRLYWLCDTSPGGLRIDGSTPRDTGHSAQPDAVDGLEHAPNARCHETGEQRQSGGRGRMSGAGCGTDSRLVHCRDGKTRRISAQPGDEPLAPRIPAKLGPALAGIRGLVKSARRNRVGRLRAYGNAIVPEVAAVFIRCFLDTLENPSCE